MDAWRRISLVTPNGTLRAPGQVAREIEATPGRIVFGGHHFGSVVPYAHLLCGHMAKRPAPWAAESTLAVAREPALLRLARRSGCRALLIGPDPDPLLRDTGGSDHLAGAAADLRRIRRAGLLTVVRCTLGRAGDDAGVFGRAVWLCSKGRVAFPQLGADRTSSAMASDELTRGLAWARRALHRQQTIWHRTGFGTRLRRAALAANYAGRRALLAEPALEPTVAMRVARALARPIRVRERVAFVSTLVGAVQAGGGQVRNVWLRTRTWRDDTRAALVIRLEGTVDARAARKLVARAARALRGTRERIVIDLGGVELVSLTVLTRFLEEHAGRLAEMRGRLAFRNLRPAIAAVRENLHGMLPNAALLEHGLEDAT